MRLGNARCDGANARRTDQLDAHPRPRIDLLQVIDQLRQILDRIDVMVRGRGDQCHPRCRMAQSRDHLGHLEARQLATFAGLCTLRDLDFDFLARAQIFGGNAKPA